MRLERCPMEIQVSFPRLDDWLSYECLDEVEVGDHVEILEGARREMAGTVEVLRRGSYRGRLAKCRKTSEGIDKPEPTEQDQIVKSRLAEADVIARQKEETRLRDAEAAPQSHPRPGTRQAGPPRPAPLCPAVYGQ